VAPDVAELVWVTVLVVVTTPPSANVDVPVLTLVTAVTWVLVEPAPVVPVPVPPELLPVSDAFDDPDPDDGVLLTGVDEQASATIGVTTMR
jgi:hypothetical protein